MTDNKQYSENWLNPISRSRITCHEIKWATSGEFKTLQAGGDLYFHTIPCAGTMLHSHDFLEIIFVNNGGVIHKVNAERQHLMAGDLCFLRPDDMHGFAPDNEFESVEIVMLDFDLELALSLSEYLGDDVFLQQMTAPVLPACFKLDPVATTALYTRLLKLNNPSCSAQTRSIKLKVLLGELYTKFFVDEVNLLSESQVPEWFESLCTAMRKKENFIAGVECLQRLAGRTPGHICKAFRKYLRKTPTAFINELRINHAAWQLADTNTEILEIAADLNFQSISRFYALFRAAYGASPAAYRRMHVASREL